MDIGHIFSGTLNFFKKTVSAVKNGAALKGVEDAAKQIQKYIPTAIAAAKIVDALIPNRTTDEIIALAKKYQLHVTDEILADPVQIDGLIQNAAMKEMGHIAVGVDNNILRSALNLGVSFIKAQQ